MWFVPGKELIVYLLGRWKGGYFGGMGIIECG